MDTKEIFHDVDGDTEFFINYVVGENLLTINIVEHHLTDYPTHNLHNLSIPQVKGLIQILQKWVEL